MLRERIVQPDYWECILPESARMMSRELTRVNELLDDDCFMKPFRKAFPSHLGRPTMPIATYLRIMFLKFRYRLSYPAVVAEVDTNLTWRLFCQLGISHAVPDESTVRKLTKGKARAGVAALNEAVVQRLANEGVIDRRGKLRTDTTVLAADIAYPTDIGLLATGLKVLGRQLGRVQGLGQAASDALGQVKQQMEQARGKVKEHFRHLSQQLKKKDRPAGVRQQATKAVLEVAEQVVQHVRETLGSVLTPPAVAVAKVADKSERKRRRTLDAVRATLAILDRLIEQTKQVVTGNLHVKNRVVSVFDVLARPIRKGKLKTPTEFGRTLRVDQCAEGYITGYQVFTGNPDDMKQPVLAVEQHIERFGAPPSQVAGDRGMGKSANDRKLTKLGVELVCLAQPGPLSEARQAVEREPAFVAMKNWRAGVEALISLMKRVYGWDRCRFKETVGTEAWVDWSVLTYNLRRFGRAPEKTEAAA